MIGFEAPSGVVAVTPNSIHLVGYSGRDRRAVDAHIRELESLGVPRPNEVPAIWEVPAGLLTFSTRVVASGESSGEVEPVLIFSQEGIFLSVGSDHTDRALEVSSMQAAKEACPKVVCRECRKLPEGGWDSIEISSEVLIDGKWTGYQEGRLDALLPVDWFIERFGGSTDRIVFCGTLPAAGGIRTDASAFRGSLSPPPDELLSFSYRIEPR